MYPISLPLVVAAVLALVPYLAAAFLPHRAAGCAQRLPRWARLALPSALCLPYVLVTVATASFQWRWLAVYALLPVMLAVVLDECRKRFASTGDSLILLPVLLLLGLGVDLRWFEPAWPPHLAVFNKILLLDAAIYAFVAVRNLEGVGFDLRLRVPDIRTGLREFAFYLPLALGLGLALGFLHLHPLSWDRGRVAGRFLLAWVFTFFFIAVPEELFFRGWLQNLLERHVGRHRALALTSVLFGLSHFNKRAVHFNWRYVLLAALAGIFYGRAWRTGRRVGASAVTHATVDSIWSLWLR